MADLNKEAVRKDVVFAGTFGNKSGAPLSYTAAAAAIADKIYLGVIKAGTVVTDLKLANAALGASVTLDIGYEKVNADDVLTADLDYFFNDQAAATAGSAYTAALPVTFDVDVYLVATVGGGAATGRFDVIPDYVYQSIVG